MASNSEERDENSLRVLREIQKRPDASQRDIARGTRISLGAVNYCLRALQDRGLVKVQNFHASGNKLRYAYVLTPQGMAAKVALTREFLQRKLVEYDQLRLEIEVVRGELGEGSES